MTDLARSCEWCGAATTVMGRRFGTMCEGCFQIEDQIGVGIAVWRKARVQRLVKTLRAMLWGYTIYEHDEVRTALQQVENEWAERWFKQLVRLTEIESAPNQEV